MPNPVIVVHERLGQWARRLRPRLADRPVRFVETRSRSDLETALPGFGAACPVIVFDLARRVRAGLDDLDRALQLAPEALTLVLDPGEGDGVAVLARELGATHVISGAATPPAVADLLARWVALSLRRGEAPGWRPLNPGPPEPEPWNWLNPLLQRSP